MFLSIKQFKNKVVINSIHNTHTYIRYIISYNVNTNLLYKIYIFQNVNCLYFRSSCLHSWKSSRKAVTWWWWNAQKRSTRSCTSFSSGNQTVPKRRRQQLSRPQPTAPRPSRRSASQGLPRSTSPLTSNPMIDVCGVNQSEGCWWQAETVTLAESWFLVRRP